MADPNNSPINISILFVCLGNICRSPMAEGVFRSILSSTSPSDRFTIPLDCIDSAGTGAYHLRSPPDPRTMDVLQSHGITTYKHSARKVQPQDFETFDYIFAMDSENLEDLLYVRNRALQNKQKRENITPKVIPVAMHKNTQNADHIKDIHLGKAEDGLAHVMLFGAFGGKDPEEEVGDPYYGGLDGFEIAYKQVDRFSKNFLKWLETAKSVQEGRA